MTGHDTTDTDTGSRRAAPVLTIDYAHYDRYLEESGLSEEEKRQFLDAMWSIIVEFVAMGFAVHPAQATQEACGKPARSRTNPPESGPDRVQSNDIARDDFRGAADGRMPEAAERIPE